MTIYFLPGLGFNLSIFHSSQFLKKILPLKKSTEMRTLSYDTLLSKQTTIVAWSYGCLLALMLAQRNKIKRLILLSATPCFLEKENWPGIKAHEADRIRTLFHTTQKFDQLFLSLVQFPKHSFVLRQLLESAYHRPKINDLVSLFSTDLRKVFSELALPIEMYFGEADAILPSKQLQSALASLNPNVNIQLIKNASHAFFLDPC